MHRSVCVGLVMAAQVGKVGRNLRGGRRGYADGDHGYTARTEQVPPIFFLVQ